MPASAGQASTARDVCAVIVSFNPSPAVLKTIESLSREFGLVVVVDNGSPENQVSELRQQARSGNVELVPNESNQGIAAALNTGVRMADRRGFQWAVLLDQDSRPEPRMVEELLRVHARHPHQKSLAMVVPSFHHPHLQVEARFLRARVGKLFERVRCDGEMLEDVTIAISSGALIEPRLVLALGGFREDYFIDYVDTEFCLRARSKSYQIVAACRAQLSHRLGDRRHARLWKCSLYPTYHSPDRWYYIGRNRILTIRKYGLQFPHWLTYDLLAGVYGVSRMLLTESNRTEKLSQLARGTIDGILGKMDRGPTIGIVKA